ncbi:uncharacterized protein FOMMEDRAFT_117677 [Fomitiporia mediterranea MF3/22]|uniref:uncharacterized protein n=1 Tax=Fomitiporia mediterranea (strain MF3/22) TaxID=694068 RepID=UPI000440959A|nr:uncharacterized protein FOMMEDRAFT_117677 [Fomitiporia mediterranea MF3/22]EJD06755.1 hypothetical protein FOMMEDRAFT_117677 [Fomitiporia mediterranea MF3/22]
MSRLLATLRSARVAQPSKTLGRRLNSTSSTQQKAQEKAQEALVAAQKGLAKAVEAAKKASGGVGERAGSMLGSYREPIVYNLQVGRELVKQVYIAERLQPPSMSTFQSVYQTLWQRTTNLNYWRELARTGEYKRVGIYALEAYGIFKIGEILGRRHLVGYKLD